jgi:glycerol-3-phosphate acyltransferase PlsY
MTIEFALLLLGSYLLGSVPAAYLAAKWSRGIDIRQYGSGNVGAGNLLKLTSKWIAIVVIIFDAGKGMAPVWAAQLIGLELAPQLAVGLAAIIGHNWPVFLRFSGGRGVLTTVGVLLVLAPWLTLLLLAVAFLFGLFRLLALGTLVTMAALPLCSWFLSQPFGIKEPLTISLGFLAIFLIVVIRRLTAPKSPFTDLVSRRELLLSRLLFDRDIMDRKAWLEQQSLKPEKRGEG